MSNVNIKRAVENIRAQTTVYTPLVETIINGIQAIDCTGKQDGQITVTVHRAPQSDLVDGKPEIESFDVTDSGVGFTDEHRESFDTLYTEIKIKEGGKGFGRFMCLKYFEDIRIDSIYFDSNAFRRRTFAMGKDRDIIVEESISDTDATTSGTTVRLISLRTKREFEKKLSTVARTLVEKMLPYFITANYQCPKIILTEADGSENIVLNDFVDNELSAFVHEIPISDGRFALPAVNGEERFSVRLFKIYYPKNQRSRLSLVAHKREVSGDPLHKYVPEFEEEFYEGSHSNGERNRNYIIKAYVFGDYLDAHVSLERGGFEFQERNDVIYGVSEEQIAAQAAEIARFAVGKEITSRQDKKREQVSKYVDTEAPWQRSVLAEADLTKLNYNPSEQDIDSFLNRQRFNSEARIKRDVVALMKESDLSRLKENVPKIVKAISETSKNELIHYIALRLNILELFSRSLQSNDGKYSSEGIVHDIIFPRRSDSERVVFDEHNLWIIDERLNFTRYLSSDIALDEAGNRDRPDLIAYDQRVVFRGDNEASNAVTIFEFKKPGREDFANPSSKDDPVAQIVRYVNSIRSGEHTTPEGRPIQVGPNTPFYGYVICDVSQKVATWLENVHDFKQMPDRQGWFIWKSNINLYMEVLTWDKILKDANMRNRIFFNKLGI